MNIASVVLTFRKCELELIFPFLYSPRMYSTRTAPWRPNSGKKENGNGNTSGVSGLPGAAATSRMQPEGGFAGANGNDAANSPEERGDDRFEYE